MTSYSVKIALGQTKRTIVVPADISFHDLHILIRFAMEWSDSHLHQFEVPEMRILITDPDFGLEEFDEGIVSEYEICISECVGKKISYVYDFGDWWNHRISIEECEHLADVPVMTECKGGAYMEDSGGRIEEWSRDECKEFMSESNELLKTWRASVPITKSSPHLPYWASVPLAMAFMMPDADLLLDPDSGAVYSRGHSKYFPLADEKDIPRLKEIPRQARLGIRDIADLLPENATGEGYRESPIVGSDPEEMLSSMDAELEADVIRSSKIGSYEIAKVMGYRMEPVDFMDRHTDLIEGLFPYLLMPLNTLCPFCYSKLANPVPDEKTGYIKAGYLRSKRLTMTCVECGRRSTIRRSLPLDGNSRWSYEEPKMPLDMSECLDNVENPHKNTEETDAYMATTLFIDGYRGAAVEFARRLHENADDHIVASRTAVLGACGIIGPEDVGKTLAGIGSEEDVYDEDSCILCMLNEALGLGDGRFGREALDSRLSEFDEEEKAKVRVIGARMLRERGRAAEAAAMAHEAITNTLNFTTWHAVDEYFRSAIAAGDIPDRSAIDSPPTSRGYGMSDYRIAAIRYRVAAIHHLNGDRESAIEDMSRVFASILNGNNDEPRLLARASVAALFLHLNEKRYKGKNLVAYSVKWICKAVESGFATEDDLDEYLSSMIPLVRDDEDETSIAKMLKKNGFGGHAIPAKLNEDADIADFFDMGFQYSY